MDEGNAQEKRGPGEDMEFPTEEKVQEYQGQNRSFTIQNNNRQKDVKDELNVDRMKYAAYLDEDKDPRAQRLQQQASS